MRYQNLILCLLSVPALGYFSILTTIQLIRPPLSTESLADVIVSKGINYSFYIGMSIGLILCTPLADRYGRKRMMLVMCFVACPIGAYGLIAKDNFDFFIIMAMSGMGCGSYYGLFAIYMVEITFSAYISFYFSLLHLAWPLSSYLALLLAKYIGNWSYIIAITCCFPLFLLLCSQLIAESPNFLMAKGEYTEAAADANKIVAVNTERKAEIDINETILYFKEFIEFDNSRVQLVYQYPLLWHFNSSREYLLVFSELAFFTLFTFAGLLQLSTVLGLNHYFPLLFVAATFLSALLRKTFKPRTVTSLLLFLIFIFGSLCAIVMLYMRIIHDFAALFLCMLSFITVLQSLTTALVTCPCRVRATGFGCVLGIGIIGGIFGWLLGEYSDSTILFFSISAVLSSMTLKRTKRVEILNKNCTDIYEIFENKCKQSTNLVSLYNTSFYSAGRESSVRHISMIELGSELESCSELLSPLHKPCEHFVDVGVQGAVHGVEEVRSVRLFRNGLLKAEASDAKGRYVVEGCAENFKHLRFTKKRNDVLEVLYTGERINSFLVGRWKDRAQEGDFKWVLQMEKWEGNIKMNDTQKPVAWLINRNENAITGVSLVNEGLKIMKGVVKEGDKLAVQIVDAHGKELGFEGEIKGNSIEAIHEGKDKMLLQITHKE